MSLGWSIVCDRCNDAEHAPEGVLEGPVAAEVFRVKGWTVNTQECLCPSCTTAEEAS